jgi:glycerophosphoryl diester phosphodiesterase
MSLASPWIATARELGCSGMAVEWSAIDEPGLARAAEAGLEVAAWTVRDLAAYRGLAELGVIAICAEAAALDG